MDVEALRQNWALAVALVLLTPALILVGRSLVQRSAWGRLRAAHRKLHKARRQLAQQESRRKQCERRVAALEGKAARVRPRLLDEAREALTDAAALQKIRADQVLVAANHVRKIIHSEYSPQRQVRLREKYLPNDREDRRPFSF